MASSTVARSQNELWVEQLGTSGRENALAAAADGAGGVFVGGWTDVAFAGPFQGARDAWLARLSPTGAVLWTRQLGTAQFESTEACAADGAGGVFVAGTTDGDLAGPHAGNNDGWIARYDAAGNQLWITQFGGGGTEWAKAVAPDGSGGAYVGGYGPKPMGSQSNTGFDAFVAHFDAAGVLDWSRAYGSTTNDWLYGAAPDGAGGVFLTGFTPGDMGGPNAGGTDVWISRYDASGNQVWIRQFGSDTNDFGNAICSDGAGGLLLGGSTWGQVAPQGTGDLWVARFDGAGNQQWALQFGSQSQDELTFCATDESGGCFVGGHTNGDLGGPNQGLANDVWTARIDAQGAIDWLKQIGSDTTESAFGGASDGTGGCYLAGHTFGDFGGPHAGGIEDVFVARFGGGCDPGENFCTALVSSSGCLPAMATNGASPSLGDPTSFHLIAQNLEAGQSGLVFFGASGEASLPFFGGTLCVGSPLTRLPGGPTGGAAPCSGQLDYTLSTLLGVAGGGALVVPGATIHAQGWFRDLAAPLKVGLTDGLRFIVCN